jgi:serine protease Do
VLALGVGVVLGAVAHRSTQRTPQAEVDDIATVFDRVRPSVVDLRVLSPVERVGAGVVVGPTEILTARHLILDAGEAIEVRTHDGRTTMATVRGTDARTDLALLVVDDPLQPASMTHAGTVRVGDTVLAVGNPFGLTQSLSVGVVGAKDRRLEPGSGSRVGFLQLSIPLNPGNSGGPIFDLQGRMVGLLTGTHTEGQAIAFAVPTDVVALAIPALRDGQNVSRGFLGLRASNGPRGVAVDSVIPTGPADAAGIRAGDLLTRFDDRALGSTTDLYAHLDALPGGHRTSVHLLRDGTLHVLDVELTDWALQPVVVGGMTLRPVPGSGGRVVAVRPRSRAARAGVEVDDIVQTVDGLPMRAPADVRRALRAGSGQLGIERDSRGLQLRI